MSDKEESYIILNKDNFLLWKWALTNSLDKNKIGNIITQEERLNNQSQINWSLDQSKGKTIIQKSLSQDDLLYIIDCQTVASIVNKLERRYNRGVNSFQLNQKFTDLKWGRTDKADQFISKLNAIKSQFISLNQQLDDGRMVYFLQMENAIIAITNQLNSQESSY